MQKKSVKFVNETFQINKSQSRKTTIFIFKITSRNKKIKFERKNKNNVSDKFL